MTTQQNYLVAVTVAGGLILGCSSTPAGPERGSAEWYWQSAMETYATGDFPKTLEELDYAADAEDEFAARAGTLKGILTAALARAGMEISDACRVGMEENESLVGMLRTPLQQAERDAKQNIISFVEGLGDFKSALGAGDVTLAFPFPPGNRNESVAINSLKKGEKISEVQLAGGVDELRQLGVVETVAMAAGMGDNVAGAQAKLDAGPVTIPAEQFKLTIAGFLVEMSGSFTQKKMNDPKIREVVIQRAEEWIASGLESGDANIKKRAEDLKFDIENERRDMKGEKPLKRS